MKMKAIATQAVGKRASAGASVIVLWRNRHGEGE